MTPRPALSSDSDQPIAESFAKPGHVINSTVVAIKRDLAQWLDQRTPENSKDIRLALLETAFDRFLEERTATASDLARGRRRCH